MYTEYTTMGKPRHIIYHSRLHIVVTIGIIFVPFIFLLLFTQYAKISTTKLFADLFISSVRLLVAYSIAAVLAWTGAVVFYRGRRALVALPLFDVLQSFPTFAALPLAVHVWGPSTRTVIVLLVLTIVWPILFSIISSLKLMRKDWEDAATIAGLKGFGYLRHFLWPVSLPGLITGSLIGLGEGWEALVATEIIVATKGGLGSFFSLYAQNAFITAFGIIGLLLFIFSMKKLVWLPLLERSHRVMED